MRKYRPIEVSESQLEDLIRQAPDLIEEEVRFVDHQVSTDRGRLDLLLIDSGNALVVAELKVVEEDGMLVQGLDYYDYVTRNLEAYARAYGECEIDPQQAPRLFLIAPSFSTTLLNRIKWLNIPISTFMVKCILLDGGAEITPFFFEVNSPVLPERIDTVTMDGHLSYITDDNSRNLAKELIDKVKEWGEGVLVEPRRGYISMKYRGRVFSTLDVRRKHFIVNIVRRGEEVVSHPVRSSEDLASGTDLVRENFEKIAGSHTL